MAGPTAKETKYDRQLRLWAASGQQALEDAHVLLLNGGGVVGVEALKNLILPGIGSYTIVDDGIVAERDLGINFFLAEKSRGKSRAEETCRYLTELNPDVQGHPVQIPPHAFLEEPHVLNQYSLVLFVASPQSFHPIKDVSEWCFENARPLFYIHSLGLFSQFSIQLPETFPVVDTHPDPNSTQDLRLLEPWPELKAFMRSKTKDLDTLSDHDHGHVPYLLLLLRFLEDWKESHEGNPPKDYKEKKEFKSFVESKARTNNPEGGEENFDEAAAAVLKSLNEPSLPSGLQKIFDEMAYPGPEKDSANFWLVASAIQEFHEAHGSLPLPGALPDMKAQSQDYIQLQNIYKAKARQDVDEVAQEVRAIEADLGRQIPVEMREIEAACKGAAFLKLIEGEKIFPNPTQHVPGDRKRRVYAPLGTGIDPSTPIFMAFYAYDYWLALNPDLNPEEGFGIQDPEVRESLLGGLKECARGLIDLVEPSRTGAERADFKEASDGLMTRVEPILEELLRADGAELHNISALTGGMVAQEAIKVLTKQYIPIDNTCVFDGIASKSAVFRV